MMKHFLILAVVGIAALLGTTASLDARGGGGGGGGGRGGGGYGHGGYGHGGYGHGGYGYGGYGRGFGYGYGYGLGFYGGFYPGLYGGYYGGYYGDPGYYGPSPYYYPPMAFPPAPTPFGAAPVAQGAPALAQTPANIRLIVPDPQAKVVFNDHLTTATGTERNFHTPALAAGKSYTYRVRATWMKDGKEVTQDRLVEALSGQTVLVDFNAPANANAPAAPPAPAAPAVAQKPANIRLIVPDADAKVVFNGHQTSSLGTERNFHTPALAPGKTYTYRVHATWMKDGREVSQERLVEALPGQTVVVNFNTVTDAPAQSAVIPTSLKR